MSFFCNVVKLSIESLNFLINIFLIYSESDFCKDFKESIDVCKVGIKVFLILSMSFFCKDVKDSICETRPGIKIIFILSISAASNFVDLSNNFMVSCIDIIKAFILSISLFVA